MSLLQSHISGSPSAAKSTTVAACNPNFATTTNAAAANAFDAIVDIEAAASAQAQSAQAFCNVLSIAKSLAVVSRANTGLVPPISLLPSSQVWKPYTNFSYCYISYLCMCWLYLLNTTSVLLLTVLAFENKVSSMVLSLSVSWCSCLRCLRFPAWDA
ncbi:hypothetical protein MAM1_0401c10332 [Mucor ambiguus]|uniref:Uncharacterized protein n=1 Tax=Mucor ambiguus TaxID=91626 RepID=A0A0C9MTN9_9FUNG|nr:hypothetical protein MAM1_0401c10332 [Mucor ambiguus]